MTEPCEKEGVLGILTTEVANMKAADGQFLEAVRNLSADIKDLSNKINARPSWSTTIILTLLTGACASMAMYIITTVPK